MKRILLVFYLTIFLEIKEETKLIISIFNAKGGVGKSTTCTSLAAALTKLHKKVLCVDMDAQANTTCGLGVDDETLVLSIYDLLKEKRVTKEMIQKVMIQTEYENLYLLPSDITLSNAEITLANTLSRESILAKILDKVKDDFDVVLLDCAPSLGLLSINALVASDRIIVPLTPGYFGTKGIKHLIDTIDLVKDSLNPTLDIMGVLITKYDERKNIAKDLVPKLKDVFENQVFDTIIRVDSKIEYAQENRKPIVFYKVDSRGAKDYMDLAKEVLMKSE